MIRKGHAITSHPHIYLNTAIKEENEDDRSADEYESSNESNDSNHDLDDSSEGLSEDVVRTDARVGTDDAVRTEVNTLSPTGATAIGAGMQQGIQAFLDASARPYAAKTMVAPLSMPSVMVRVA